jgi:hypothetical protein
LMDYGPKRLCYVSCNDHTQARDVGWLVGGLKDRAGMYEIESVRGFDFFPQTSHVEGVAFLRRVDKKESAESVPQPELPKEGEAVVNSGEEVQDPAVEVQKEI